MKKYEGLFILDTSGKEEGIKENIDMISEEIHGVGGTVETVQKMDKRPFSRVADRKHQSGFYVNFIFQCQPEALSQLRSRFKLKDEVFRIMFTRATATSGQAEPTESAS